MADQTQVTDEQRLDSYAEWLRANKDKAGSPEFVKVADAYRQLRMPSEAVQPDPYSFVNTAGRIASDAVLGLPDLLVKLQNAGLNPLEPAPMRELRQRAQAAGQPGLQTEFAPRVRSAVGVEELPEDASTTRRLSEAGMTALLGSGGGGALGALSRAGTVGEALTGAGGALLKNVAVPTATSFAGGAVGEKYGGETGALIGSLAGGVAPGLARNVPTRAAEAYYGRGARVDAPEIAAAAERQNVTPSAGMLGGKSVQATERRLSGQAGSQGVIANARDTAANQITQAAERAVEARRAIPAATPETADIVDVANRARTGGQDVTGAVQTELMNRIGSRSPVDVSDIYANLGRIQGQTDPATYGPIATRVGHLREMIMNDQLREALMRGGTPPAGVTNLTVPYEQFKDWRSKLGARLQGLDPIDSRFQGQVYDEATQAMRNAAIARGVPGPLFDRAQEITRNQYQATTLADKIASTLGTEGAAGPRQFSRWWENLTPEEQTKLAGPQQGAMSDVARLAGAHNYPTSQTGLTRSLGGQLGSQVWRLISSLGGAGAGHALGIPGGEVMGAVVGGAAPEAVANIRARMLQSDVARRGMTGQRTPIGRAMGMDELLAALQAANIGAR